MPDMSSDVILNTLLQHVMYDHIQRITHYKTSVLGSKVATVADAAHCSIIDHVVHTTCLRYNLRAPHV